MSQYRGQTGLPRKGVENGESNAESGGEAQDSDGRKRAGRSGTPRAEAGTRQTWEAGLAKSSTLQLGGPPRSKGERK